jgi:hypothetical protein
MTVPWTALSDALCRAHDNIHRATSPGALTLEEFRRCQQIALDEIVRSVITNLHCNPTSAMRRDTVAAVMLGVLRRFERKPQVRWYVFAEALLEGFGTEWNQTKVIGARKCARPNPASNNEHSK